MNDRDPETFAILGAAFEVRRHLTAGFQENVYGGALAIEFGLRRIPFEAQVELAVHYKDQIVWLLLAGLRRLRKSGSSR